MHQKHDRTYEVIKTTYNPITNTISFKTDSFSNYAIAAKKNSNNVTNKTSSNPQTGDNILNYIIISIISLGGLIITSLKLKNIVNQ